MYTVKSQVPNPLVSNPPQVLTKLKPNKIKENPRGMGVGGRGKPIVKISPAKNSKDLVSNGKLTEGPAVKHQIKNNNMTSEHGKYTNW